MFYVLGEVLSKSVPFLLLPFMTRVLGVEGIATLIYYTSLVAVIILPLSFSQDGAVMRYCFRYGRRSLKVPVYFSFFYSTLFFIVISLISFVADDVIIMLCALTAYTSVLFSMQLTLQQCQKESKKYFYLQAIHAIGSVLVLLLIFHYFSVTPENRIASIAIANILAALFGLYLISSDDLFVSSLKLNSRLIKLGAMYILGFGFPLFFHQLSLITKNHIDKLILSNSMDVDSFGIYAVSFQLGSALSVFILAINKAILPYYYEGLKNNKWTQGELVRLFLFLLLIFQIPAFVSFLAPSMLYVALFGAGFEMLSTEVPPFLMGFGLVAPYLLLVNYFFYYGNTGLISFSTIISSCLYLILLVYFLSMDVTLINYTLFISNLILLLILFMFFCRAEYEK